MMEQGQKIAIMAIVVNVVLFATKYMFAGLSGSIALKAGAFDSMSDVVASSTVFVGLVISRRKTKSFPYGLYKVEILVTEGTTVKVALESLGISYGIDEMKKQLEPSLASASENDELTNSRAV
jgi:divalent metal cation (Fe/Co/Zn/Cd) transporter